MKIKEMNLDERPREKALRYGFEVLNDRELLCLLIGSGNSKKAVGQIADEILRISDNLAGLMNLPVSVLMKIEGIGQAKALQILASVELARRSLRAKAYQNPLDTCEDVAAWMEAEIGFKDQECFICLFLDTKKHLIDHKVISIGTLDHSVVHPRDIFREAYIRSAHSLLFVHNHPSGDISPSRSDILTTQKLKTASEMFCIPVLDHLIVSRSSYFSFRAHGVVFDESEDSGNSEDAENSLDRDSSKNQDASQTGDS